MGGGLASLHFNSLPLMSRTIFKSYLLLHNFQFLLHFLQINAIYIVKDISHSVELKTLDPVIPFIHDKYKHKHIHIYKSNDNFRTLGLRKKDDMQLDERCAYFEANLAFKSLAARDALATLATTLNSVFLLYPAGINCLMGQAEQ